jgi:formamidopyrimidine-DNA glycosylase
MPELPEVHTTVTGLQKVLPGLSITDVWSDMWSTSKLAKNTIKDRTYFSYFKKYALASKVQSVTRRAKHILINLENGFTIIIHMKMTGHLMYGTYKKNKNYNGREWSWLPLVAGYAENTQAMQKNTSPLLDPYNRHVRVVFTLSNMHHLVFCDSRKFGTIVVEKTSSLQTGRFSHLGPEPLETSFALSLFKERLLKSPARAIKTVLMDHTILAGVGNIYSDEILWLVDTHPLTKTNTLSEKTIQKMFKALRTLLRTGIDLGGDSMSDYRNIFGEHGAFQKKHKAYQKDGLPCSKRGCTGTLTKIKIGGRSAHFCPIHQKRT